MFDNKDPAIRAYMIEPLRTTKLELRILLKLGHILPINSDRIRTDGHL